jgi:hypothetical protein
MGCVAAEINDILPSASDILRGQWLGGREVDASSTFPSKSGAESRSNFKQSTSGGSFLMAKENNSRCNIFWLEFCNLISADSRKVTNHFLWHNCPCHICSCSRRNNVDENIVFLSFSCKSSSESDNGKLSSSIISLSKISINPRR